MNVRKVFLTILIALLAIFICVSCNASPSGGKEASDERVDEVVTYTIILFDELYYPVSYLAGGASPSTVKTMIESELPPSGYEVTVTANSITITGEYEDEGLFTERASITNISYSESSASVSGKFSYSWTGTGSWTDGTESEAYRGSFNIGATSETITYSEVSYNGTSYKVDKFNTEMKSRLN